MIGDRKYVCKSWGCEEWIVNEEYCGKKIVCVAEWSSQGKYHYHMVKDETFYVTKGSLILDIQGDKVYKLSPGDSFRVKPNIRHRFRAQYSFCLL
jgi:mannose-6-phosphate isomerase-like protein (cupin superfamily)